jgi:hypothetical protein
MEIRSAILELLHNYRSTDGQISFIQGLCRVANVPKMKEMKKQRKKEKTFFFFCSDFPGVSALYPCLNTT